MGFIGDLTNAILISWVVYWIFAIIYFFASGQRAMATLFGIGLVIPSVMIAYEYWKYRKRKT